MLLPTFFNFVRNCRNPTKREVREQRNVEEIQTALTLCHKEVQLHLQENNESLGVFEDEDVVLRCKG